MRAEIEIGGRRRQVAVRRMNGALHVVVDGREWIVDAVRVDGQTLSLLVQDGSSSVSSQGTPIRSYEVVVTPHAAGHLNVTVGNVPLTVVSGRGRSREADRRGDQTSGPQRIVAPMPGKVVRVLVGKGEKVRARQTVVVIEAMKMENELRAVQDGTVTDLQVRNGQSVEAGALLALITS